MIKRKKLSKKKAAAVAESMRIPAFVPDFVETGTWRYIVNSSASQVISFTLELPIAPFGILTNQTAWYFLSKPFGSQKSVCGSCIKKQTRSVVIPAL